MSENVTFRESFGFTRHMKLTETSSTSQLPSCDQFSYLRWPNSELLPSFSHSKLLPHDWVQLLESLKVIRWVKSSDDIKIYLWKRKVSQKPFPNVEKIFVLISIAICVQGRQNWEFAKIARSHIAFSFSFQRWAFEKLYFAKLSVSFSRFE